MNATAIFDYRFLLQPISDTATYEMILRVSPLQSEKKEGKKRPP